ncbi:hypothetical protein, partial [Pseudomonas sp. 43NM1]|uniref:hypothetical protein n=1 Tax=Pseudomonas sp. 43NM1 TaxID=1904755 RepID=UPI001C44543D
MLAKAVGQVMHVLVGITPSRASFAPTGFLVDAGFVLGVDPVGAELARESGGSGDVCVGWDYA